MRKYLMKVWYLLRSRGRQMSPGLLITALLVSSGVTCGIAQAREVSGREWVEIRASASVPTTPQLMPKTASETKSPPLNSPLIEVRLPDEQALLASVPPGEARAALAHVLGMLKALFSGQGAQLADMFK